MTFLAFGHAVAVTFGHFKTFLDFSPNLWISFQLFLTFSLTLMTLFFHIWTSFQIFRTFLLTSLILFFASGHCFTFLDIFLTLAILLKFLKLFRTFLLTLFTRFITFGQVFRLFGHFAHLDYDILAFGHFVAFSDIFANFMNTLFYLWTLFKLFRTFFNFINTIFGLWTFLRTFSDIFAECSNTIFSHIWTFFSFLELFY